MTEDRDGLRQELCLLLDEELGQRESLKLLSGIEADPELREQWRRYNLIGIAMRSRGALLPDRGFVDRVSAALVDEPTVLAPSTANRSRREKAVTIALAASLAAVAIMVGKSLNDYSPTRGPGLLAQVGLTDPAMQSPMDPEFRDYLVAHYETAYLAGAQGMLPSVRLVSSDSTR